MLFSTVEELSGWHSPPQQRLLMRTQTDPADRQKRERKLKVYTCKNKKITKCLISAIHATLHLPFKNP